jgi:sigma54-dependent transcription regulator
VIGAQRAGDKPRDHVEHRVREAADNENIGALLGLRGAVRLDIDAGRLGKARPRTAKMKLCAGCSVKAVGTLSTCSTGSNYGGAIQICREAKSLSDAGRKLFGTSRGKKTTINDADRLRKYLARFDLDWQRIAEN